MHLRIFKDFKTRVFHVAHDYNRHYMEDNQTNPPKVTHERVLLREASGLQEERDVRQGAERAPGAGRDTERDPAAPVGNNNFHGRN